MRGNEVFDGLALISKSLALSEDISPIRFCSGTARGRRSWNWDDS
jgi:hypothetical protein